MCLGNFLCNINYASAQKVYKLSVIIVTGVIVVRP